MAIRKRKGKSGIAYQVYWNNPYTGKRESKTYGTLAEARSFDSLTLHRLAHEQTSFKPQEMARQGDDRNLEDAAFLYIREKKFSDRQTKDWLYSVSNILKYYGFIRLLDFNSDNFRAIQQDMQSRPSKNGGAVSNAYVHTQMSRLRTVIRWAHEGGMIKSLPLMKLCAANYARTVPPTSEETIRIIAVSPPHLVRVVVLGAALGLRVGASELLALTWDKVDLVEGVVRVDTSRKNKTSPWREVPIREDILPLFQQWKKEDEQSGLMYLVTYKEKPVASVKKSWATALKNAGITRNVRPYDLRHTFATQLLSAGADVGTVAELLGHSSPQMVFKHYQHVLTEQKRRAVESLPSFNMCQGDVPKEKTFTELSVKA